MITDYFMITEKSNRLLVIMITDYDYPNSDVSMGVICKMTSSSNSSQSTHPTGGLLWEELFVLSRFHS